MDHTIYLDNAATTRVDDTVLAEMLPYLAQHYGNPSSSYSYGRAARIAVENARRSVAYQLGVKASSIFFTSGGTESNNTAIAAAVRDLGCTHIISSPVEHHAVLNSVEFYSQLHGVPYSMVAVSDAGIVDYADLERQLKEQAAAGKKCLVSLMHANNETGSMLDVKRVGALCQEYGAIFHSDCVQTVGHYPLNLPEMGVHFISGSGHKFHGPKGSGILYIAPGLAVKPFIHGGGQERNMRAGTECVHGIVGFARALELAMEHYKTDSQHIGSLKAYMKKQLVDNIPGVTFNGHDASLYTVLSVCFPKTEASDNLLLRLDMEGICVSGGSACSGPSGGSHVMKALGKNESCTTIRFSFSKYNTTAEIDHVTEVLKIALGLHASEGKPATTAC